MGYKKQEKPNKVSRTTISRVIIQSWSKMNSSYNKASVAIIAGKILLGQLPPASRETSMILWQNETGFATNKTHLDLITAPYCNSSTDQAKKITNFIRYEMKLLRRQPWTTEVLLSSHKK